MTERSRLAAIGCFYMLWFLFVLSLVIAVVIVGCHFAAKYW